MCGPQPLTLKYTGTDFIQAGIAGAGLIMWKTIFVYTGFLSNERTTFYYFFCVS